jgi:hypothetical protein
MHIIEKDRFKIITHNRPFKDFNLLQGYAHMEGYKDALLDGKDKYYTTAYIDGTLVYSWTAVAVNTSTLRIVTKLYAHPEHRNKLTAGQIRSVPLEYIKSMSTIEPNKLKIVTRSPEMTPWRNLFKKSGYSYDDQNVYLIGSWKHTASAWKNIYYLGDINLLDRPKMPMSTYQLMFESQT